MPATRSHGISLGISRRGQIANCEIVVLPKTA